MLYIFLTWLAGFLVNLGVYLVRRDEWKVQGEGFLFYLVRVIAVLSTSWVGVGIVLGRISLYPKNLKEELDKDA